MATIGIQPMVEEARLYFKEELAICKDVKLTLEIFGLPYDAIYYLHGDGNIPTLYIRKILCVKANRFNQTNPRGRIDKKMQYKYKQEAAVIPAAKFFKRS